MHKQVVAVCRGSAVNGRGRGSTLDDFPPWNRLRLLCLFIKLDGNCISTVTFDNAYADGLDGI